MDRLYRTVWSKISNTFVAVGTQASGQGAGLVRPGPGLMQLEPRLVFDGAAVDTFASAAIDDDATVQGGEGAEADIALPLGDVVLSEGALSQAQLDSRNDVNRAGMQQLVDAQGDAREVVIIDSRLPDLAGLLGELRAGTDVWLLDAGGSALDQISTILSGYQNLDALHLVSHGSEGAVYLGAETISSATLVDQANILAAWGGALSVSGDILLYGCDIAVGESGMAFMSGFAAATGADIAASDDPTGASALGGDWDLETRYGAVSAQAAVAPGFADYDGLLGVVTGTSAGDSLTGSPGNDTIYGLGGNDTISALDGDDLVYGDEGNDTVYGGGGVDTLYGGVGNDFLYGGTGDDFLYGEDGNDAVSGADGNDTLFGGAGRDTVIGSSGDDYLVAGDGDDWVWGGKGNDLMWGDDGSDTLSGGANNDTIYGGDGHDVLSGHSDADFLYGGNGNDVLRGGANVDVLFGGAGADTFTGSVSNHHTDSDVGDTLGDLEADDVIVVTGVGTTTNLTTANVRFNGAGFLEVDTNGTDFSTVEIRWTLGNNAGSSLQVDTVTTVAGTTTITFKVASATPASTDAPAPIEELIPTPVWPTDTSLPYTTLETRTQDVPSASPGLGAGATLSTPGNLGLGSQVVGGTTSGSPLAAMLGTSGPNDRGGGLSAVFGPFTTGGTSLLTSFYGMPSWLPTAGFGDSLADRLNAGLGGLLGAAGGFAGDHGGLRGTADGAGTAVSPDPDRGVSEQPTGQPGVEGGAPADGEQSADETRAAGDDLAVLAAALRDPQVRGEGATGKPALSEQLRHNSTAGRQAERDALRQHARAGATAPPTTSG